MKFELILVFGVIGVVLSAPASDESRAVIVNYENNIDEKGNYNFSFKTSNGIERLESGQVKNAGQPDEHIVVTGEYSYIDPNGELVEVHYYADEDGFHILPQEFEGVSISGIDPNVVASLLGG